MHIGFDPTRVAIFELVSTAFERLFHGRGDPELHGPSDEGSIETLRGNPDDGVRDIIKALHLAHDLRIAFIPVAPHLITDHDDGMRITAIVFIGLEAPAEDGMNANGIEVVGGNDAAA